MMCAHELPWLSTDRQDSRRTRKWNLAVQLRNKRAIGGECEQVFRSLFVIVSAFRHLTFWVSIVDSKLLSTMSG